FAHEHRVCADVNDALLLKQTFDERFDLRIDERLSAANGDHRGVAFVRCGEAILQRQEIFERGRIFADPAAASAGEIARVQRLELQDRGELIRPAQLLGNDVGGDLSGQRQRESHKSEDSTNGSPGVNRCYWRSFRHPERSRGTPRNNLRRGPSTPLRSAQDDGEVSTTQWMLSPVSG